MVGPRTGARVLLLLTREGDTPRPYVVGDLFPMEHGDMRYIICPGDHAICRTAHVSERIILDAILEPGPVPVVVAEPTPIPVGTQAHAGRNHGHRKMGRLGDDSHFVAPKSAP